MTIRFECLQNNVTSDSSLHGQLTNEVQNGVTIARSIRTAVARWRP